MIDPLTYFWLLLKASLVSASGTGNLPALRQDFIPRGLAGEQTFAEALAIGQLSPGPTGLWVIGLGYLTYGPLGALLATIAISIPPLLVLPIERLYRRIGAHPAMTGFISGLSLAGSAIFVVTMLIILGSAGIDWRSLGIAGGAAALALTRRVPVIAIVAIAGAVGMLVYA